MTPIRIGIVGCGSVMEAYMHDAQKHIAANTIEITAACDVREERRRFVREQFGVQRITDRYQDVIDAPDIDLVMVLTSMNEHGPIAHAALKAGKHVIVEKPMSTSLNEAAAMVETAKTSKGYLLVAPHVILSPTFKHMAERIQAGDIGKVCGARAIYGWRGPEWGKWFYQKGGGPIFDLGVYNITTLTGWLGPAKRVMAMTGQAIPERMVEGELMQIETEDNAQILLDFGGACYASIYTGFTIEDKRAPAIELYGREGVIQMLGDDWAPEGYEIYQRSTKQWTRVEEKRGEWPWVDGLNHMIECIQQNKPPVITPAHAYHVLEIMLKAMQSGAEGRAIELTSTFTPLTPPSP
jgi:predicted dehydrogenase